MNSECVPRNFYRLGVWQIYTGQFCVAIKFTQLNLYIQGIIFPKLDKSMDDKFQRVLSLRMTGFYPAFLRFRCVRKQGVLRAESLRSPKFSCYPVIRAMLFLDHLA